MSGNESNSSSVEVRFDFFDFPRRWLCLHGTSILRDYLDTGFVRGKSDRGDHTDENGLCVIYHADWNDWYYDWRITLSLGSVIIGSETPSLFGAIGVVIDCCWQIRQQFSKFADEVFRCVFDSYRNGFYRERSVRRNRSGIRSRSVTLLDSWIVVQTREHPSRKLIHNCVCYLIMYEILPTDGRK